MKLMKANRADRRGVAVVAMVAIMAILCIIVFANVKRLQVLDRELKLVEQRQTRRLQPEPHATNRVDAARVTPTSSPNESR